MSRTDLLGRHLDDATAYSDALQALTYWTSHQGAIAVKLIPAVDKAITGIRQSVGVAERARATAIALHARAVASATAAGVDPPEPPPDPVASLLADLPPAHARILRAILDGVFDQHD